MAQTSLKVGILIVSTTASKNPESDKSEFTLRDVINSEGGGNWEVVASKIVADHVPQIQRQIMLWADVGHEAMNLILTTGGTGFAVDDHTPEVQYLWRPANKFLPANKKMTRLSEHSFTNLHRVWSMPCWLPRWQ